MQDQSEKTEVRKAMLGFTLFGIILLALMIVYRDLIITATAIFVFIVFLVMYYAPRIREQRDKKKKSK
jgi:uncharacterized membrane protein YoaK (UPF0700 family)